MRLRDAEPRKHVHAWKLTHDSRNPFIATHRLERRCDTCPAKQHAIFFGESFDLPPAPLRALADVPWSDGKLGKL